MFNCGPENFQTISNILSPVFHSMFHLFGRCIEMVCSFSPYAIGYIYSVVIGGLLIRWFIKETHNLIIDVAAKILNKPEPFYPPWDDSQTAILGFIEIALFTTTFIVGRVEFIGIWLGIKTVAGWSCWNEKTPYDSIQSRSYFNIFLIGNGFVILFSGLGGYFPLKNKVFIGVAMAAMAVSTIALTIFIRHLRKDENTLKEWRSYFEKMKQLAQAEKEK